MADDDTDSINNNKSEEIKTDFLKKPCNIKNIQFSGVERTNRRLLRRIVAEFFNARTFEDFISCKFELDEKLHRLNAFKHVEVLYKPSEGNDCDIKLAVEERGFLTGSIHTDIDINSNAHLSLKANLPNLNGIGDVIALETKFNKAHYVLESRYSIPLLPWRKFWAPRYSVFFNFNTWDRMSSNYDQKDKSFVNLIEFNTSPFLRHSISFENVWRAIRSSSDLTPIEIRKQTGHSLKSAIKYVFTWDNRDERLFHESGCMLRLSNEVTTNLIKNSAKFSKHELHIQMNQVLMPKIDLLCQLNVAGGILYPAKTNICDKFFIGGPISIRGFKLHGIGSNALGSPLGGDTYLLAGIHLYPPMPYNKNISEFVRPHIFVNAGTIGNWKDLKIPTKRDDFKRELCTLEDSMRYSCGFGLVMRLGSIRIELNYCIPLISQSVDMKSAGVQFGFGLSL